MAHMDSFRLLLRRALGQAGYTLMETLVVMTILVVVIGAVADGFTSATRTETDQTARASDQEAAREALERLRRDIHCASSATLVSNSQNGYTLNLTVSPTACLAVTTSSTDGVQWCTVKIGTNRYGLYRTVVSTCDAADAVFQVDYITRADVWQLACGDNNSHLESVAIDLPVNRDITTRPGLTYELTDQIALRNDTATTGAYCQQQP
jgi:prepilin-type N-terminal cleavage/methylation domain-containing protein